MTVAYPLDKSRDVDRRWTQRLLREANGLIRRAANGAPFAEQEEKTDLGLGLADANHRC